MSSLSLMLGRYVLPQMVVEGFVQMDQHVVQPIYLVYHHVFLVVKRIPMMLMVNVVTIMELLEVEEQDVESGMNVHSNLQIQIQIQKIAMTITRRRKKKEKKKKKRSRRKSVNYVTHILLI